MQKSVTFILVAFIIVAGCITVALEQYSTQKDTQKAVVNNQVTSLQGKLKAHDAVAARNDANYTSVLKANNDKRAGLCAALNANPKVLYDKTLCL